MTAAGEEQKPTVLLVDLSGIFWRSWMSQGETLKARDRTLELVRRCMDGIGFMAPVALCLDRGRSFRKDLFAEYKAQRPEKDLQAVDELRRVQQAMADEGFTMWGADGFEADDVIATATRIAAERGHPVRVASADKDLLQLLDIPGVTVLRTHDFSVWTFPDVKNKYGVDAGQLGDWLALVGDKSDNIRGCPGVGDKNATKLLAEHGTLEAVIAAAPAAAGKSAIARALVQCADDIRRDRKLVELRFDAPLDFEEIYRPRERKRAANVNPQEELTMPNELSQGNELGGVPVSEPAVVPPPAPPAEPAPPTPAAAAPPASPAPAPQAAPAAAAPPPTAIAKSAVIVPEVFASFDKALEPVNAVQALSMARTLWRSGLYSKFPNEEAVYAVITRGREIGIPAGAALDVFHYMPDVSKIAPLAHFVAALVERDQSCEYLMCVESDDKKATYEFKHRRHPRPRTHTYTIEEAVQAGLCQLEPRVRDWTPDPKTGKPGKDHRGPWDARRPEQLRKTCVVQVGRIYFPAAALGLYAMEEFGYEDAA